MEFESPSLFNRRRFLRTTAAAGLLTSFGGILPGLAQPGRRSELSGTDLDLTIAEETLRIGGRRAKGITINGVMPGPLIRLREGDDVTIRVHNQLDESTSIHWHGLILPFRMDGVPGVSFAGIPAGETFTYRFPVRQSGTYWYHSHSGLQEQLGHAGSMIIEPRGGDPVAYDREYIVLLSDW
ncbi:MAG: multicopper oxidase domain-containing protein [Chthoniobacterales bacterium]